MASFRPHELLSGPRSVFKQASENSAARLNYPQGIRAEEEQVPTPSQLIALAKRLFAARSRRKDFIAPSLFGEPGWDMLLALFIAQSGGYRITVSGLCGASHAPPTTALRWLTTLGELDLVRRFRNPIDFRVVFIELQPAARSAINAYLGDIWDTLFAPDDRNGSQTAG